MVFVAHKKSKTFYMKINVTINALLPQTCESVRDPLDKTIVVRFIVVTKKDTNRLHLTKKRSRVYYFGLGRGKQTVLV